MTTIDPFKLVDRYIELKKKCIPQSWGDTVLRINEMIFGPLIAFTLAFMGNRDILMLFSAVSAAHKAWTDWLEYDALRFQVQNMYLATMAIGGPFITTNDPTYQAYVFADAIVRAKTGMLKQNKPHLGSEKVHHQEH